MHISLTLTEEEERESLLLWMKWGSPLPCGSSLLSVVVNVKSFQSVSLLFNSFAESCDFLDGGLSIRCDCREGYSGERCERCSAGYYGQPEVLGKKSISNVQY